jgi:hypothetical protein
MRFTYGFARFLAILLCVSLNGIAPANGDELRLRIRQGQTFFELVGQNNVFAGTNPQRSLQVGYLSRLEGIRDVFSATPADEKTANFTFTNDVLRTQVNTIGTVSIIQRDGAFTIYLNSLPADFSVLSSFSTGVAILTGTSHQQVTVDNTAGSFSAYTDVEVTSTVDFALGGTTYEIGKAGDTFRVYFYGAVTGAAVPSASFGGYASGTGKDRD